jgi:hypothetical protein
MNHNDERVKTLFEEWQKCRADLQDHSQQLEAAMQQYIGESGAVPTELSARVKALRKRCDALFTEVLAAINERAEKR